MFFIAPCLVNNSTMRLPPPRCCDTCYGPKEKYISVDASKGFCGETCITPTFAPIFRIFEPNLTRALNKTCEDFYDKDARPYSLYAGTVTHGIWPVRVTLDLFAPNCTKGNMHPVPQLAYPHA